MSAFGWKGDPQFPAILQQNWCSERPNGDSSYAPFSPKLDIQGQSPEGRSFAQRPYAGFLVWIDAVTEWPKIEPVAGRRCLFKP
jgi:hypothetical protein